MYIFDLNMIIYGLHIGALINEYVYGSLFVQQILGDSY